MKEIFSYKKLYRAYLDCRRTKRKTINALEFEKNFERNLFELGNDLKNGTYSIGRSVCFAVKEPCVREIFAGQFRDRVVHHLLVNEIGKIGEKCFAAASFACRPGKGTHNAAGYLRQMIKKASCNNSRQIYYLQMDISGFFMAIDHSILYALARKMVFSQNKSHQWKTGILGLIKVIIFNKPTQNYFAKGNLALLARVPPRKSLFFAPAGKGLPIGNYSSQFFANLYLNELDQFVKRRIKCRHYARYVDDFILLSSDKEELILWRNQIADFLKKNLKLAINHNKQRIQPLAAGIDFLGYFIKPDYVLVRRKVVCRMKSKLREFERQKEPNAAKKFLPVINSYFGHFKHANSYRLRKSVFEKLSGGLKDCFAPKSDFSSLRPAVGCLPNSAGLC